MKRFQSIVLFTDHSFVCGGFDELSEAILFCRRKRDKITFTAFVLETARGDIHYFEELA